MDAPVIACAHLTFYFFITLAEFNIQGHGFSQAMKQSFMIAALYALSLFTSIIIYRIVFHPLRAFHGPFLARISKFWHVKQSLRSQNHLLMNELHEQYGDFVRTGNTQPWWDE